MKSGWSSKIMADGLALFPPGGRDIGAIRMSERVRPLASVAEIIAPDLERMRRLLTDVKIVRAQRLATLHAEYAAFVVIGAVAIEGDARRPVERTIGIVYGDEFYEKYDAIIQDPAQFELFRSAVREFVEHSTLGLGDVRWRRYLYVPPADWQPLVRHLTTEWYPLDYPNRYARITIPPAYANQDPTLLGAAVLKYTIPGFAMTSQDGPTPIDAPAGVRGARTRWNGRAPDGRHYTYEQALLYDQRFSYMVHFECDEDTKDYATPIFERVVKSIEQFPTVASVEAFSHWAV